MKGNDVAVLDERTGRAGVLAHSDAGKAWAALDTDMQACEGDGLAEADRNKIWAKAGDNVAVVKYSGDDDDDSCVCGKYECTCVNAGKMLAY